MDFGRIEAKDIQSPLGWNLPPGCSIPEEATLLILYTPALAIARFLQTYG
jgi:hypothetical protein